MIFVPHSCPGSCRRPPAPDPAPASPALAPRSAPCSPAQRRQGLRVSEPAAHKTERSGAARAATACRALRLQPQASSRTLHHREVQLTDDSFSCFSFSASALSAPGPGSRCQQRCSTGCHRANTTAGQVVLSSVLFDVQAQSYREHQVQELVVGDIVPQPVAAHDQHITRQHLPGGQDSAVTRKMIFKALRVEAGRRQSQAAAATAGMRVFIESSSHNNNTGRSLAGWRAWRHAACLR